LTSQKSLNEATSDALLTGNIQMRSDRKMTTASTSAVSIPQHQITFDNYANSLKEKKKINSTVTSFNRQKDSISTLVKQ
jgi:hypothetical protein